MKMDTDRLMETGERGIHLLFDTETIAEAYRQDADRLRDALAGRLEEIHFVVRNVLKLRDANAAREYIASLAPALRHILVLLYFEVLESRLRKHPTLH
jgi:hypothetical protein